MSGVQCVGGSPRPPHPQACTLASARSDVSTTAGGIGRCQLRITWPPVRTVISINVETNTSANLERLAQQQIVRAIANTISDWGV